MWGKGVDSTYATDSGLFYVDFFKTEGGPADKGADSARPKPHPSDRNASGDPPGEPQVTGMPGPPHGSRGVTVLRGNGLAGIRQESLGHIPLLKSQGFRMGVPVSVLCGKLPLVVNRQFKFCNFFFPQNNIW